MSTNKFTEDSYEQTLISLFKELGYQYECGYDVERDYRLPYHASDLKEALQRLNPMLSAEVLNEAFRLVTNINEGTLEQRNEQLMDYLQSGVEVKYSEDGRSKTALVRLIDFENPQRNSFVVRNQWRVVEYEPIRCDMVVFINGLPLVVIELKSPSREETDEEDAYTQIKQYQQKCPSLFVYNAFNVKPVPSQPSETVIWNGRAWMVRARRRRLPTTRHSSMVSLKSNDLLISCRISNALTIRMGEWLRSWQPITSTLP